MDSLPQPREISCDCSCALCRGQGTSHTPSALLWEEGCALPCSCWDSLAPASCQSYGLVGRQPGRPQRKGPEEAAQHLPVGYHSASPPHIFPNALVHCWSQTWCGGSSGQSL